MFYTARNKKRGRPNSGFLESKRGEREKNVRKSRDEIIVVQSISLQDIHQYVPFKSDPGPDCMPYWIYHPDGLLDHVHMPVSKLETRWSYISETKHWQPGERRACFEELEFIIESRERNNKNDKKEQETVLSFCCFFQLLAAFLCPSWITNPIFRGGLAIRAFAAKKLTCLFGGIVWLSVINWVALVF